MAVRRGSLLGLQATIYDAHLSLDNSLFSLFEAWLQLLLVIVSIWLPMWNHALSICSALRAINSLWHCSLLGTLHLIKQCSYCAHSLIKHMQENCRLYKAYM